MFELQWKQSRAAGLDQTLNNFRYVGGHEIVLKVDQFPAHFTSILFHYQNSRQQPPNLNPKQNYFVRLLLSVQHNDLFKHKNEYFNPFVSDGPYCCYYMYIHMCCSACPNPHVLLHSIRLLVRVLENFNNAFSTCSFV